MKKTLAEPCQCRACMAPTEQENETRLADVAGALNRDHWVFVVTEPYYGRIAHWVEFPWPGDSIPVPPRHEGVEIAPRQGGGWTAADVWYEVLDLLAAAAEERVEARLAALHA